MDVQYNIKIIQLGKLIQQPQSIAQKTILTLFHKAMLSSINPIFKLYVLCIALNLIRIGCRYLLYCI